MEMPCCSRQDRLSKLPPHVVKAILVLLPIRDAARTSILSRSWRYRWNSISQLVFDERSAPHLDCLQPVDIVNRVLLCHKGPIHKFQCSSYIQSSAYIDAWIVFLSKHGIKEFILGCVEGNSYEVFSRLFSYQDLCRLELTNCIVQPPPASCSLASLRTLVFHKITITSAALENLLSICKFLADLTLEEVEGLTHLKILALNLKTIRIDGSFKGLILNTPLLLSAEIIMRSAVEKQEEEITGNCGCNSIKVLGDLLYLENLVVAMYFLGFLAGNKVPQMLPITYKHLKHLNIDIDFTDLNEISTAYCLIACAPHLEHIQIFSDPVKGESDSEDFVWEAHGALDCLNSMKMSGIRGSKNELAVLEFVLVNAGVLTVMTIQFSEQVAVPLEEQLKFLKSLIQFRRASPQATITCLDTKEN